MNIQITTFVTFSGQARELEPLISDIADAIVRNGYAVDEDNDNLCSLIVVKETDIVSYESSQDFVNEIVRNSISVVIPVDPKEMRDDSDNTGD